MDVSVLFDFTALAFGTGIFIYGLASLPRSETYYETVDGILLMLAGILIVAYVISTNAAPSAMDVYQGKTTLRISSENGVPVDSVVVFKEGINND